MSVGETQAEIEDNQDHIIAFGKTPEQADAARQAVRDRIAEQDRIDEFAANNNQLTVNDPTGTLPVDNSTRKTEDMGS